MVKRRRVVILGLAWRVVAPPERCITLPIPRRQECGESPASAIPTVSVEWSANTILTAKM
jgi:hypothetical protein